MKKLFLISCLLFLIPYLSYGQINLVPNPSFENLSQCPTFASQLEYATPWFQPYVDISGNQTSSSDLFSTCCTDNFCSEPNNFIGEQTPKTGNTYAGIWFYYKSTSQQLGYEYIENILADSLIQNNSYCIKFYVSLAERCNYAISNIQVYFSNDSCLYTPPPFILPYTAQITNPDSVFVSDKINWKLISLPYQAQGGERFITIGNFDNDTFTYKEFIGGGDINDPSAYYYIDDVSVIDISTPAYAGVDTTIALGDSVFIGRQPEIGLNDDCVWYVNGNPFDTVAGLWVMPDSTTTYILEQTICGYTTYDTVTVTVLPTSINELFKENNLKIFPNPSTGDVWIKLDNNLTVQSIVIIYDIAGKIVFEKNILIDNNTKITPDLHRGTYFINIQANNNTIKPFNDKVMFIE